MWKNLLESYFLAKNCFETLRLIGPHLDEIPLRLRLWPHLALRLTKSWSQWRVWRIRPKMMTSTAMMERSSRWATRAAGRRTRTASRLSAGFPKLQFWFQTSGAWKKNQFKTHPWNGEKCKRLPKGRLRNRENVECIEMYRNVSDKKTELYMYNSKKWSYTCITRKNGVIHV